MDNQAQPQPYVLHIPNPTYILGWEKGYFLFMNRERRPFSFQGYTGNNLMLQRRPQVKTPHKSRCYGRLDHPG